MTDLVTRLRALDADYPHTLLREAADALERANSCWDQETRRADDLKAKLAQYDIYHSGKALSLAWKERDEALAKLAGASALLEHARDCHVETAKRAEKAEAALAELEAQRGRDQYALMVNAHDIDEARAEAAALRKVILNVVEIDRLIGGNVPEVQVREIRHFDSDSVIVTDFIDALSSMEKKP